MLIAMTGGFSETPPTGLDEPAESGSPSTLNQQPNQPNQPAPKPNQPQADPIFATMELFRSTIARLDRAKIAKTWAPPKMDAGLAYDLVRHSVRHR